MAQFSRQVFLVIIVLVSVNAVFAKKKPGTIVEDNYQTNPISFFTKVLMRLVYGIATATDNEEELPAFFKPPGSDDYYDYSLDY